MWGEGSRRRRVSFYQDSTWGKVTKENISFLNVLKSFILKRSESVLFENILKDFFEGGSEVVWEKCRLQSQN